MADLYLAHYDGSTRKRFEADLATKNEVLLIFADDVLIGFTTLELYARVWAGQRIRVVYSGDTVVDRAHWGQQTLAFAWIRRMGELRRSAPEPLYWFLIVKGHRTFRYLPAFAQRFIPHWNQADAGLKPLLDFLASEKFGADYNPASGVVEFAASRGHLRAEIAEPAAEELTQTCGQFLSCPESRLSQRAGVVLSVRAFRGQHAPAEPAPVPGENGLSAWEQLAALAAIPDPRPLEVRQTGWLHACLQRNADCEFGRCHGFADIDSVAEYQRRVPLCDYDSLREPIRRIADGAADVLFAGTALAFERTGGSSGGARLIPYTTESLLDFRCALLRWLHDVIHRYALRSGSAYWALSPATRPAETTPGGLPVGLPDGAYFGAEAGALFASLSAVPLALAAETELAAWQRETLCALLRRPDLVLISVWSPSFFTCLLDALPLHAEALMTRLRTEDAAAATRLADWLATRNARLLWPDLRLVSAWADASSRAGFDALRGHLPHAAFQPKGLLSTEAVVTVPDAEDRPVLAADSGFHEFISAAGDVLPAWQLREGERYEVLLTTAGGLYRYRTGDRVECTGHAGDLPVLHFVGRCGLSSDLVGEKLTDDFVADCLQDLPGFAMLLPVAKPAGYLLVSDGSHPVDLIRIDNRLCRNPQYAYARKLGQLPALQGKVLPDALLRFSAHEVAQGRRLGDVKLPALCLNADWLNMDAIT